MLTFPSYLFTNILGLPKKWYDWFENVDTTLLCTEGNTLLHRLYTNHSTTTLIARTSCISRRRGFQSIKCKLLQCALILVYISQFCHKYFLIYWYGIIYPIQWIVPFWQIYVKIGLSMKKKVLSTSYVTSWSEGRSYHKDNYHKTLMI